MLQYHTCISLNLKKNISTRSYGVLFTSRQGAIRELKRWNWQNNIGISHIKHYYSLTTEERVRKFATKLNKIDDKQFRIGDVLFLTDGDNLWLRNGAYHKPRVGDVSIVEKLVIHGFELFLAKHGKNLKNDDQDVNRVLKLLYEYHNTN